MKQLNNKSLQKSVIVLKLCLKSSKTPTAIHAARLTPLPYDAPPEEAEKHIERQRAPDHKVVDPRPVPRVQGQLEKKRS